MQPVTDGCMRPSVSETGFESGQWGRGCVHALKTWTGKTQVTTINDSAEDEFTDQGFFDKVMGKRYIALVVVTADGDVFGGFNNLAVTNLKKDSNDQNPVF